MDMNYRGGMWEGGGWAGWSGMGGEWDNCNSIINKYIKKKELYGKQSMYLYSTLPLNMSQNYSFVLRLPKILSIVTFGNTQN